MSNHGQIMNIFYFLKHFKQPARQAYEAINKNLTLQSSPFNTYEFTNWVDQIQLSISMSPKVMNKLATQILLSF